MGVFGIPIVYANCFPPYFYSWTENIQKSSKKSDANDSKLKHAFKNQHEHQNK